MLDEFYGRAVDHDFGSLLGDGGWGVANANDGIGANVLGGFNHAIGGDFASVVHHLGVAFELSTDEVFETTSEVAEEVDGLDCAAANYAKLLDFFTVDCVCCN